MEEANETRREVIVRREVPREHALLARVVWFLVDTAEILLALRFLFRAFGANAAGFAALLYGITDPLVAPFRAVFPATTLGGVLIEWGTLLAMAVYLLLGTLLVRILRLLFAR